jgi:hypothetical protein
MIVGTSICIASWYYLRDENSCAVKKENVMAGVIMVRGFDLRDTHCRALGARPC